MKFFSYLELTLSDPNDKQGSTKRLCLFLFMLMLITLLSGVTIYTQKLPEIPASVLNLVYFIVGTFVGATSIEKGIAAYKTIKGVSDANTPADPAGPAGT